MNTVVLSLCGHDKGKKYIVLYEKDGYAYLCDGKNKKMSNPKKKKKKHIAPTGEKIDLSCYNPLYDAHILKELKSLLK